MEVSVKRELTVVPFRQVHGRTLLGMRGNAFFSQDNISLIRGRLREICWQGTDRRPCAQTDRQTNKHMCLIYI